MTDILHEHFQTPFLETKFSGLIQISLGFIWKYVKNVLGYGLRSTGNQPLSGSTMA